MLVLQFSEVVQFPEQPFLSSLKVFTQRRLLTLQKGLGKVREGEAVWERRPGGGKAPIITLLAFLVTATR